MAEEGKSRTKGQKIFYLILIIFCFGMGIYCLYKAFGSFGVI